MITPYIIQPSVSNSWIATLHIEEMKEYVVSDVFSDQKSCELWIQKRYAKAFASCVMRYVHQRKKAAELAGWPHGTVYEMEYLERELGNLEDLELPVVLRRIQKVKDSLIAFLPSEKSSVHRWREVIKDVIHQTEIMHRAFQASGGKTYFIKQPTKPLEL